MQPVRIAIIGAGLIGKRHAQFASAEPQCELAALADPAPTAKALAAEFNTRWYADAMAMLEAEQPEGVIIATPNHLHVPIGKACVEKSIPMLVEKPLADNVEAGEELVTAAEQAGVAIMVGHHRRFNPMVESAREIITSGTLGRLVAVSAIWSVRKPDDYFQADWRRQPGGGPILINLIHDIDCLRHFCGEIDEIQAFTSSAVRNFAVEDSAAILIRFVNGALATITLSDVAPSPWGWEMGSGDNPNIAHSEKNCYRILGTEAALDFPNLTIWRNAGAGPGNWSRPLASSKPAVTPAEALAEQMLHFAKVIRGEETPRVSGRDGLATLAATMAVHEAAQNKVAIKPQVVI